MRGAVQVWAAAVAARKPAHFLQRGPLMSESDDQQEPFRPYLARWGLTPAGEPFRARRSWLLPVTRGAVPAMLKLPFEDDEKRGSVLLAWWNGEGAARLLAHDAQAQLLERACGTRSLSHMARAGEDDQATRILCAVIAQLHRQVEKPVPELCSLEDWFADLWAVARERGGLLARGAEIARRLLDAQTELTVLHGDIHHDNVLDFGARGWLAIDPKRLHGDRAFDYANIFCNPQDDRTLTQARFARRLEIVSLASHLARPRLLAWIAAWTSLSAAWWLLDDTPADLDFAILTLALDALAR